MKNIVLITALILSACTAQNPPSQKINIVDGRKIHKPNCPDWSGETGSSNFENYDGSNYGCSTVNNMGEMVLDKRDLVVGKSAGSDVSRSALAVTRYRSGGAISTGAAE